jgi:hypothetical protein
MPLLRRQVLLAACGLGCGAAWSADAPPPEVATAMPGATLRGEGRLRFLGMRVYGARLFVLDGFRADDFQQHPAALELRYERELSGPRIAERSLVEMRKVGEVPEAKAGPWLAFMQKTFPDVKEGDRITGLHQPGEGMAFFVNGKAGGALRDAEFARLFMGIWLSPRSSEPALRRALLGLA